jgi:hypothetical protein
MSDRAPPPALPWACVDTPPAKRVRTETPATAGVAAEELQPPLFGLKLGDRIEVVWEYKHDDDDDDDTVEAKVVSTAVWMFTAFSSSRALSVSGALLRLKHASLATSCATTQTQRTVQTRAKSNESGLFLPAD